MQCNLVIFCMIFITAELLFPTEACCCSTKDGFKVFEADLTSGEYKSAPAISWMKSLGGSGTCNLQGVVKITLPSSISGKQKCRLKFDLHMLKDLSKGGGWNFNIGDSSNNGYGGDASHTSNSAEVHNIRGSFYVYSNTLPGYTAYTKSSLSVDTQANVITNRVTITVGDEFVHFDNHRGIQKCYGSPYLFTLNGQATTYGTRNYDIYFSMNRVIYPYSYTSRTGTGLCKAVIRAIDCGPTLCEATAPPPQITRPPPTLQTITRPPPPPNPVTVRQGPLFGIP